MLQIYNTLTRQKEIFQSIKPKEVGIYVCGMTVYDYCHLGHGRILVIFDMMTRYLREQGYQVHYVRNITDIDDKIINRAHELGEDFRDLTARFIKFMHEDERALNILPPNVEPRATEHIPEIIKMIEILLSKDYAYIAENGDVYYDVTRFSKYGQLAQQDLEDLQAGARVSIVDVKRNPLDFVLWKLAKPEEPSWDSPWGLGRPGWHIECSAMSTHCLGSHFDIHGGGIDLRFPHHQNEIAQSEASFDTQFANTWIHGGHVQVNSEKMSKSLGNFFTIREVLTQYPAEVIRYFMLASHYRSPINYSTDNLDSARYALGRFYQTLRGLPAVLPTQEPGRNSSFETQFKQAMDDDFNTPVAISVLFDLAREINRLREENLEAAAQLGSVLRRLAGILGLLQQDSEVFLQGELDGELALKVEGLIRARKEARANKDWAEADRIRTQLDQLGIVLEDGGQETTWKKKSVF
jgi:cysteinyl-tRNA synthetase